MREPPDAVISVHLPEPSIYRGAAAFFGTRLCWLIGSGLLVVGTVLAPLSAPAQTFIRVEPPSVEQQDRATVTAMPPSQMPSGAAATPVKGAAGAHGEAVLSGDGKPVKMYDANGKEVSSQGPSWKNWRPTFYANLRLEYDDNIFIQRHKEGDFVTTIDPGIVLGWGDYRSQLPRLGEFEHEFEIPIEMEEQRFFYIDYHPSFQIFAKNSSEDAVDEYLTAAGSYRLPKLTLSGRLTYELLSGADVDVGDRVGRALYAGSLSGIYSYSTKSSIESTLSASALEYDEPYQSSVSVLDRSFLGFQVAPKTNVAGGIGLGYLMPEKSANQAFQQALVRVTWAASDKFYLNGTAGLELREINHGTTKFISVYDLGATYAPFDGTRISLTSSRSVRSAEAELGQDLVLTNIQFGVQQRFLTRLYVTGGFGYSNGDYEHVASKTSNVDRSDDAVSLSLSAGMDLTAYAGIQIASRFLENDSTVRSRAFDEQAVSIQLNLTY